MEKNSTDSPLISVIIPTLNEEHSIEETLNTVMGAENVEIIISDGGSSDATAHICREKGVTVINASPGRGPQMNGGAKVAKGEILLFLHADTLLPLGWQDALREVLINDEVSGGAFSFALSRSSMTFSFISFVVNLRSKLLGLPYGDQALFMRRKHFEILGGFRPIPIMEDVALVSDLKKLGTLEILDSAVITSSRRWEKEGWIKTTLRNQCLLYLYLLGVSPEKLYRFYQAIR